MALPLAACTAEDQWQEDVYFGNIYSNGVLLTPWQASQLQAHSIDGAYHTFPLGDGSTFLSDNGTFGVPGSGNGTIDHALLSNLAYADAGHTGFQAALGFTAENSANKAIANGYASLNATGKVPLNQIDFPPGSAAWGGITGTLSSQTDLQSALDGKQATLGYTPADNVTAQAHYSNTSNPHSVTKAQVGLANADNTADGVKNVAYANTSGTATSANTSVKLTTARTIGETFFDGTANIVPKYSTNAGTSTTANSTAFATSSGTSTFATNSGTSTSTNATAINGVNHARNGSGFSLSGGTPTSANATFTGNVTISNSSMTTGTAGAVVLTFPAASGTITRTSDIGGSSNTTYKRPTNSFATSSTSLVDIKDMFVTLDANAVYLIEAGLTATITAVTTGARFGVSYNGTLTGMELIFQGTLTNAASVSERVSANNTQTTNAVLTTSASTIGAYNWNGVVRTGANGGTRNFGFKALKVTSGTLTIQAGSMWIRATRIE